MVRETCTRSGTVNSVDLLILGQAVPFGDLATRVVTDLPPVLAGGACRRCSQHHAAEDGVGGARSGWIGVHQQQLHASVPQAFFRRQIEHKELVEDWVGGALLHMRLLFAHTLLSMVHVHLDIWICSGEKQEDVTKVWKEANGQLVSIYSCCGF